MDHKLVPHVLACSVLVNHQLYDFFLSRFSRFWDEAEDGGDMQSGWDEHQPRRGRDRPAICSVVVRVRAEEEEQCHTHDDRWMLIKQSRMMKPSSK